MKAPTMTTLEVLAEAAARWHEGAAGMDLENRASVEAVARELVAFNPVASQADFIRGVLIGGSVNGAVIVGACAAAQFLDGTEAGR